MPELPEVETVRAGLAAHLLRGRLGRTEVLDARSLRRHPGPPESFVDELAGSVLLDVARRGKYLWLLLGTEGGAPEVPGEETRPVLPRGLVVHLGMSGQVLIQPPEAPAERHLRLRIPVALPDGTTVEMRFVDQRIFGGMFLDELVAPADSLPTAPRPGAGASEIALPLLPASVAHIGRDPLDPWFDDAAFRRRLLRTESGIKRVLLDQTAVSGIGNIYADEALWRARLHYAKPARSLTAPQTRQLLAAVREVLAEALAAGGTSFDALYVNVNGESGYFERGLNAYGRAGKPCPRCGAIMVREPFMNRSSFRCPQCQRAPRGFRAG